MNNDNEKDKRICRSGYNNHWKNMLGSNCILPSESAYCYRECINYLNNIGNFETNVSTYLKNFQYFDVWEGIACSKFGPYLSELFLEAQSEMCSYINDNGQERASLLQKISTHYTDKYESWNIHVSSCDLCSATLQTPKISGSFTTHNPSITIENSSALAGGSEIYIDFGGMSSIIESLTALKENIKSVKDTVSSTNLPEFRGDYAKLSESFTTYRTNACGKIDRVIRKIDRIISSVNKYIDKFTELNQPRG